ncbi:MAG: hypothetical protein NVSMB65_04340 [Chloroflexota bacterium]
MLDYLSAHCPRDRATVSVSLCMPCRSAGRRSQHEGKQPGAGTGGGGKGDVPLTPRPWAEDDGTGAERSSY